MTWIQTYTGLAFDFVDPRPDQICIEDVAHALAFECRYGGHPDFHYSVAQHSVIMSEQVDPELAYWALMHDAAEAYLKDLPAPLKRLPELAGYRDLEARIEPIVFAVFGLTGPIPTEVKADDLGMLATEQAQLHRPAPRPWGLPDGVAPFDVEIESWEPNWAESMFLATFAQLAPAAVLEAQR